MNQASVFTFLSWELDIIITKELPPPRRASFFKDSDMPILHTYSTMIPALSPLTPSHSLSSLTLSPSLPVPPHPLSTLTTSHNMSSLILTASLPILTIFLVFSHLYPIHIQSHPIHCPLSLHPIPGDLSPSSPSLSSHSHIHINPRPHFLYVLFKTIV